MKKINSLFVQLLFVFGICIFIAAFILSIFSDPDTRSFIVKLLPILALLIGFIDVVIAFSYTKTAYHLFVGLFIIFWGVLVFLRIYNIFDFTLKQWWPILGVSSGAFLFVSGLFRYRKFKIGYVIPASVLFFMGLWLMLFSFKIITIPFKEVALVGGPLLAVLLCIFCVVLIMLQNKYKSFVVIDDEDDGFEDDEITIEGMLEETDED
ncbi:MAG: hypothetical protein MJ162_00145 [Treponema sp.]|nr:hypothetical protein [Treponema sp.]